MDRWMDELIDRWMDRRMRKWIKVMVFLFFFYREFFHLLSQELVNPQYALFQFIPSSGLYKPNLNSAINPNHLFYFEFFGKILAKAICEGTYM